MSYEWVGNKILVNSWQNNIRCETDFIGYSKNKYSCIRGKTIFVAN